MINNIDNIKNNNFLKDYIDYHFKKEKKKFLKLKYNLTKNNFKKNSKINSYNDKRSNNKKQLPYINKKLFIKSISNNHYNSIKISKKDLVRNYNQTKHSPTKIINNIYNEPIQNKNKNKKNIVNDSDKDNSDILLNSHSEKLINLNFKGINENKPKSKISKESSNSKMSSKILLLKNLKFELDKELIINDKESNKNQINKNINLKINNINDINIIDNKENNTKMTKIKSEIKKKKEENENSIIDTLYIGNNIINNCIIKNKLIYDIRPLNKTKEKASCHFPSENDSKAIINEKQSTINSNCIENIINNTNLKYLRNSYSQEFSGFDYHNKFLTFNSTQDQNDFHKKKELKYELSEQGLINLFKENREEDKNNINCKNKNKINNKFKNELSKEKYFNNIKKDYIHRNKLEYIDLAILAKEISNNNKHKSNLHSYFSKEGNVIRGEKIKFLKTCSQVKLIKPLLSQHLYEFKTINGAKKIFLHKKKIKFPTNHFNLDILNETNMKKMINTEKYLFGLKKDINQYLSDLANNLDKEINYFK